MDALREKLLLLSCIALIGLLVTDCSCGRTRHCPGQVRMHVYDPPSVSIHTDSHGRVHSTYHAATYRLLIECRQPDHVARVSVSVSDYVRCRDDQFVVVGERLGRWSGITWSKWIDSYQPEGY